MAVIALADCTVSQYQVDGWKTVKIVTPATADDTDTIDVSSLFDVGCNAIVSGASDGTLLAADVFGTTITLPGATDDEARTIVARGH